HHGTRTGGAPPAPLVSTSITSTRSARSLSASPTPAPSPSTSSAPTAPPLSTQRRTSSSPGSCLLRVENVPITQVGCSHVGLGPGAPPPLSGWVQSPSFVAPAHE